LSRTFTIKRGDTSPSLRFALEPESVDLTSATCTFQMRLRRGAVVIDSLAVVESASPPVVRYNWADGDTGTVGTYEAEFRVTYADGAIETFPNSGFISVLIKGDVR
jgi:hypothetical protein